MRAVGTYLRTLREQRGLTMAAVAQAAGVSNNYIWRIEAADIKEPSATNLAAILKVVRGSAEHLWQLLLKKDATEAEGEALATAWLTEEEYAESAQFVANIPDEQVAGVIAKIEQLQADPKSLARLDGYIERLLEEQYEREERDAEAARIHKRRRWLRRPR